MGGEVVGKMGGGEKTSLDFGKDRGRGGGCRGSQFDVGGCGGRPKSAEDGGLLVAG